MSILEMSTRIQTSWWHLQLRYPRDPRRPRDERGNNSIEMAIIVGVVIVVATLVTLAIKKAVESRLDGIE